MLIELLTFLLVIHNFEVLNTCLDCLFIVSDLHDFTFTWLNFLKLNKIESASRGVAKIKINL